MSSRARPLQGSVQQRQEPERSLPFLESRGSVSASLTPTAAPDATIAGPCLERRSHEKATAFALGCARKLPTVVILVFM